jgi:hypothetical protein
MFYYAREFYSIDSGQQEAHSTTAVAAPPTGWPQKSDTLHTAKVVCVCVTGL